MANPSTGFWGDSGGRRENIGQRPGKDSRKKDHSQTRAGVPGRRRRSKLIARRVGVRDRDMKDGHKGVRSGQTAEQLEGDALAVVRNFSREGNTY